MNRRVLILISSVVVGLIAVAGIGLIFFQPHTFHGTLLQSPDPAAEFSLRAQDGQEVSLAQFRGKLVLLYFGYTYCPDVCPATLAESVEAMKLLGKQAEDVQVIMISVDPERDTPEVMGNYMRQFDARFIGLSGSPDEIARIATLYGIFYEKTEGTEATGYLVNHTASLLLLDQKGHLKLVFPYGTSGEDLASDLAYLLR